MAELTPAETAALAHWSAFGQPGTPPAERLVPDAAALSRLKPFSEPASGTWSDTFDDAQTRALLNGFEPEVMEDKWLIYSDDISDAATTSVHFHRSWTGQQIVRVDLQLTATGSMLTQATWEMDDAGLKNPGEAFAREMFLECCRWVLGMGST